MRQSLATELSTEMKLLKFKYDNNMSLTEHFMLYDELISELETASGCKLKDTNKIARLLSSLPKTYDPLVVAIQTLSDDKLSLSFVKVRLLEHEIHLKNEANDTSLKVLQAVEINKTNSNRPFKNKFVKSYKKPQFKRNKVKCHYCNKIGHIKKNCYKYINSQNKNKMNNNENTVQLAKTNSSGFMFMCDQNLSASKDLMFIIDSGASDHIINDENLFDCCEILNPPLRIAVAKNETFIEATKRGQVKVLTEKNILLNLKNVLFCKDVPNNLMSVRKMQEADLSIMFSKNYLIVKKNDKVVLECNNVNNLVKVNLYKEINYIKNDEYLLWHSRLGHISKDRFNEIKNKNLFVDSKCLNHIKPNDSVCEPCIIGKQGRLKYHKTKDKSYVQRPLFIIHTDVCGPISPQTFDDKNYFVVYVDEYTHYCCTYLIQRKSDVFETFQDFNAKASAHFNSKIVHLYSDNGTEYLSKDMKNYCTKNGISYHLTVPHSPELNGVSERMIRSLTEKARVLIHEAKLEKIFWGEAVKTATYLNNISPSKAVRFSMTPYEMWHKRKPQLKYLRKFGSTVFVHCKVRKTKFDKNAWKGILVGYDPNGYRIWNVETGKIIVARDVTVDERSYNITRPDLQLNKVQEGNVVSESMTHVTGINESDVNESNSVPLKRLICEPGLSESMTKMSRDEDMGSSMEVEEDNVIENASEQLRRSNRIRELPKKSYNELLMCSLEFTSEIPKCYNDIKGRNDEDLWKNAIDQEINALYENNTWTIVKKALNKNIVGCKWVFSIKSDSFGNPTKYKARLVAQGFSQKYLEDYEETFAPVARITSLRFLIAFANQFDLLIHQLDVRTAFLNGKLKQEIYMKIPEGIKSNENEVCRLNKALYGLKQSARCWFEAFENVLLEKGFKNSEVDRCIYVLNRGDINKNVYIVLYVDDILIMAAKIETMNEFKDYLKLRFKMTDLNEIKLFLGIKFVKEIDKISLDQSSYIEKVLKKFNMSNCKPAATPLVVGIDFNELNKDENTDFPCRNLIGCLMYIMLCTRPDLSIAVNVLSRFSNKNNKTLWIYLKRILRYLKGTINIKLTYTRNDFNNILCGYVDSDWGGDNLDKKSTTGFLFKLFDVNTISWNTRKQTSVAASSTEAEYMALFEAVRESLWLKSLSESIGLKVQGPIVLYEDNQGCIAIAKNPTSHKRSKHISIKYHFSREQVENNVIKLEYVSTDKQLADALTKPLPTAKFEESRCNIGLNFCLLNN